MQERIGRGEWIRTTDLLVPNQGPQFGRRALKIPRISASAWRGGGVWQSSEARTISCCGQAVGSTQVPRTALLLSRPLGGTNQASIGSSTNFGTPRGQARSDRSWRCLTRLNQSSFHTEWFEASAGRAKFLGISSLVGLCRSCGLQGTGRP